MSTIKSIFRNCICVLFFCVGVKNTQAQTDTTSFNIQQIAQAFSTKNLLLLAQKFDIDASKATIAQTRLWDNPSLYVEQNIYNQQTDRYFDVSKNGETIIQIQQLITIAGKRNKKISLAILNTKISEYTFYDLLRTLKFELVSDFYDNYFLNEALQVYNVQLQSLENTSNMLSVLYEKGTIPLKDVARMRALIFKLSNERKEIYNQIQEKQVGLKILLNDTTRNFIKSIVNKRVLDSISIKSFSLQELVNQGVEFRYDLKIAETTVDYERKNLSLQRSLGVPDLRLGGVYDKAGNYIPEYYALNLQIDLPVFNRNQGNIRASKFHLQSAIGQYNYQKQIVVGEVTKTYGKAIETEKVYKNFDTIIIQTFSTLLQSVNENYKKQNIGLLEFVDFFESYKDAIIQFYQLQNDRANSIEEVNFAVGKSIFTY